MALAQGVVSTRIPTITIAKEIKIIVGRVIERQWAKHPANLQANRAAAPDKVATLCTRRGRTIPDQLHSQIKIIQALSPIIRTKWANNNSLSSRCSKMVASCSSSSSSLSSSNSWASSNNNSLHNYRHNSRNRWTRSRIRWEEVVAKEPADTAHLANSWKWASALLTTQTRLKVRDRTITCSRPLLQRHKEQEASSNSNNNTDK